MSASVHAALVAPSGLNISKARLMLDITSQCINPESMCLQSFVLAAGAFLSLSQRPIIPSTQTCSITAFLCVCARALANGTKQHPPAGGNKVNLGQKFQL